MTPPVLTALSRRALLLGAALPTNDADELARWLYRFGTLPCGADLEQDLGPGDDPLAILGLVAGASARRQLERTYEATTYPGWIGFARRPDFSASPAACKLYVSPRPESLPAAFPAMAAVFDNLEVRAFKVGRGLFGLLRPDKIVAHFDGRDHLLRVADALNSGLSGCAAHGVPFTAALDRDGLLSWGIDPPPSSGVLSWRSWVTGRLARGLLRARPERGQQAADAALEDIASDGVDPETWTAENAVFRTVDMR